MLLTINSDYYLNNFSQLIFVMVKCGVLYEVGTELLNTIYWSFGFEVLEEAKIERKK
jgi:hypothetical protein